MFYQTDSVKTSYFTVKNYDGTFLPEMVDKAPEFTSYTELTEVIISAPKISSMGNSWYHLSPENDSTIEVHDMDEMIGDTSKASYVHIIYIVKHLYDTKSGTFLDSEPSVIHAKAFTDSETSEFSGTFYVLKGKSELIFDPAFEEDDTEYLETHPEICTDYIINVNYNIFIFESVEFEGMHVHFNDRYYEFFDDAKSYQFLVLNGIDEVLKGKYVSFAYFKGYYGYLDCDNWFSATDFLLTDFSVVS